MEDNAADVELVREALADVKLPHVMDVATDFEQARNYIENIGGTKPCPDVLLMDLNLPKGSGLDLLRILRQKSHHSKLPVIVVSSSNASSDRARAAELGAAHYFPKPADIDEFMKLGGLVKSVVHANTGAAPGMT